ncbi:MAG: nucleotide-binding domain containing protein, partial [Planctomycetota bacterium]
RVEVRIGRLVIDAEVARTAEERAQGLSGRDSLAEDAGMLFVLEREHVPSFWMKGMRFPLDFVWVSAEGRVVDLLRAGRSVVVYTARGPADPAISDPLGRGIRLGDRLGEIARTAVREAGIRRLVAAGGDTSGRVARALGIEALEMRAPLAPGSPLCAARSEDPRVDGLQAAFKGGQVGREDYFGRALMGGGSA